MSNAEFKKILDDAGIPTTQEGLDAQWKADVKASGSTINNDSKYSPFWKAITALITKPALWLIQLMMTTVMPNSFVKYATGVFLELLADAVNLTRKAAVKAQGVVTFTRADVASAVTIPAGTIIQTATLNGKIYQVKTLTESTFSAGAISTDVQVEGVEAGSAFNLSSGYFSILPVPIANIASVANGDGWLTLPGTDTENDDSLRARIRNQFGTASSFHTDSVYKSLIAEFPGVSVDAISIVHDAPRGPGTANAYVLFDFSAPVNTYLTNINAYITDQGHHGHGDDLQVYQLPTQPAAVVVDVWHEAFLSADDIANLKTNVEAMINAAFRGNKSYSPTPTQPFSRFSFSKLSKELQNQFEIDGLNSADFEDDAITSELWVPVVDSLDVTMRAAA